MVYRNGLMTDLARCANAIRALAMDAVEAANSGHPGMPMGMADVATVLFANHLKFDPKAPRWPDRDRFVLSAGHGSMRSRRWMTSSASASGIPHAPVIRKTPSCRALNAPPGRWGRAWRCRWAWRWRSGT
jgi:hypothetical protein